MGRLAAIILLLISGALQAQAPPAKLYAVVFEVTVNSFGKVDTLKVAKVIDPATGSTDAVDIAVPATYVQAAQKLYIERTYPANQKHFFTYAFYDPSRPGRADIDPKAGRP